MCVGTPELVRLIRYFRNNGVRFFVGLAAFFWHLCGCPSDILGYGYRIRILHMPCIMHFDMIYRNAEIQKHKN